MAAKKESAKHEQFIVRCTKEQREGYMALAHWRRLSLSELTRLLLDADRKRLAEEGYRVPKRLPEREPPR